MFTPEGKVALITGGASGIGLSIVKELLRNGLRGITIVDVNENAANLAMEEVKTFGDNKAIFVKADIGNKEQFEDAFKKTIEKFNNLDIVINNAGVMDDRQWEKEINCNINGTILGNLLAMEYIQKHRTTREGVIVNIASRSGLILSDFQPIYGATKSAIIALSRSFGLQVHYNRTKVKVITVCPGITSTPLINNVEERCRAPHNFEAYLTYFKKTCILQESAHVGEHVAKLVENGETGSVWIIENNELPYEIEIPHYQEFRKKNVML